MSRKGRSPCSTSGAMSFASRTGELGKSAILWVRLDTQSGRRGVLTVAAHTALPVPLLARSDGRHSAKQLLLNKCHAQGTHKPHLVSTTPRGSVPFGSMGWGHWRLYGDARLVLPEQVPKRHMGSTALAVLWLGVLCCCPGIAQLWGFKAKRVENSGRIPAECSMQ